MTRQEHLDLLKKKMDNNLDTATRKNNDYCGQGVEVNPFKNFEASSTVGVPAARGILVRMMDKMARISSLLDQEAQVKDESIHDTLSDLSLYALILSNYLDSKKVLTVEETLDKNGYQPNPMIGKFKVGDLIFVNDKYPDHEFWRKAYRIRDLNYSFSEYTKCVDVSNPKAWILLKQSEMSFA